MGYLLAEQRFVEISLEAPAIPLERHRTFRGVLARLVLELWEMELYSNEELLATAAELDFTDGPALLERLQEGDYDADEAIASFDS